MFQTLCEEFRRHRGVTVRNAGIVEGVQQEVAVHALHAADVRDMTRRTADGSEQLLGEPPLSGQELHWSRYYWLFRFTRVWYAVAGYDAGMEQQLFGFLEYPPDGADSWPQAEIEAAAEREAAQQVRAAVEQQTHTEPVRAPGRGGDH